MDDVELIICQMAARLAAKKTVTSDQRLYHDLKLKDDDAFELLDEVHGRFGTKFDGFYFPDYLPNESEAITDGLERLISFAEPRSPLTIHHLSEVVRRGQWFAP